MNTPSDSDLVSAARQGDAGAWAQLAERHYGLVYGIALARLAHVEAAEDAAQEVFLRLFVQLDALRSAERFAPWAARTARNLAANWKRDRRRRSQLLPLLAPEDSSMADTPDPAPDARSEADRAEYRRLLHELLEKLPEEERELVVLHFLEGYSQRELGRRLGVNPSTVGRRLEASLARLRKGFEGTMSGALRPDVARAASRAGALAAAYQALPASGKAAFQASAAFTEGSAAAVSAGTAATVGKTLFQGVALMQANKLIVGTAAVVLVGVGALVMTNLPVSQPEGDMEAALAESGQDAAGAGPSAPPPTADDAAAEVADGAGEDDSAPSGTVAAGEPEEENGAGDDPVDFALVVRGRVLDGDRRPVAGAQVRLSRAQIHAPTGVPGGGHPFMIEEEIEARTTAGEDGRYELRSRRGAPFQVVATAAGYAEGMEAIGPSDAGFRPFGEGREIFHQDFELKEASPLRGRVVDGQDEPIEHASVTARVANYGFAVQNSVVDTTVRTDGEGRFVFESLPERWVRLEARKAGMPLVRQRVEPPHEEEVVLRLEGPGATLSGTVVDWDGNPVPGAAVTLGNALPPNRMNSDPVVLETVSDGGGSYTFEAVPPDSYYLSARAEDGRRSLSPDNESFEAVSLSQGDAREDVVLRLFDGYTISGVVTDALSGEPLPEVMVSTQPEEYFGPGGTGATTNSRGEYRLDSVPAIGAEVGIWLRAEKDGYRFFPEPRVPHLRPEPGTREYAQDLEMYPTLEWEGRVLTPDGWGAAHVRVVVADTAAGREASDLVYTDAQGYFTLPVAPNRTSQVAALADGHPVTYSEPVEVGTEAPAPLEIVLDPGATAVVRVEDEEGDPVEGATVSLLIRTYGDGWSGASLNKSRPSGPEGTAVFDQLPTEGMPIPMELERQSIDFSVRKDGYRDGGAVTDEVFEAGERKEIVLHLAREGHEGVIAGVVVDGEGEPLPGVQVSRQSRRTTTGRDGSFRLEGLPEGEHALWLYHVELGSLWPPAIETGTLDAELVMEPSRILLTVLLLDAETGEPVPNATVLHDRDSGNALPGITGMVGAHRFPRYNPRGGLHWTMEISAPGYAPKSVPAPRHHTPDSTPAPEIPEGAQEFIFTVELQRE